MKTLSIREAKNKLTELAREVEAGTTVVVTRHGRPIFDLVPHRPQLGLNFEAGADFLRNRGFATPVCIIGPDFDDALAEDFLLHGDSAQP
jgi:prevent-host-death family protein